MLYLYKVFFHNKWIFLLFSSALVLNLLNWIYVLIATAGKREENFFLHYNIVFGVDLFGPWWKLFFIPLAGFAVFLVNLIFSFLMFNKNRIISIAFAITSLFSEIFALWALYLILRINL